MSNNWVIEAIYGDWKEVELRNGDTDWIPPNIKGTSPFRVEEFHAPEDVETITTCKGWGARYTMPGYVDSTEWCAVYDTEEDALLACEEELDEDGEEE